MPSLAFLMATFMPRTCEFIRSAIARPAASSFALLTRKPVDRRWIDCARTLDVELRLRCAFSDIRLVLIIWAILKLRCVLSD
jgi:hypothetical protein